MHHNMHVQGKVLLLCTGGVKDNMCRGTGKRNLRWNVQVGGSRAAAKAAEPYLRMMGKHVLYCGKQGNGQAAKAPFLLSFSPLEQCARLFLLLLLIACTRVEGR